VGFNSIHDYAEAIDSGKFTLSSFRKVPSQASVLGIWCDLSMAAGNPVPNYYSSEPLVAAKLLANKGIYHGQNVAPSDKYLTRLSLTTPTANAVPSTWILCDYLLYYPVIDMDSMEVQLLDNTVTLDRYTSGEGVQAMIVATTPYAAAPGTFTISYVNTHGETKTSRVCNTNVGTYMASIVSSGGIASGVGGPWIPLASGDTGIQEVISATFTSPAGGLAAIVLVKPLMTTMLREITATVETELVTQKTGLVPIKDGAYLNMIGWTSASVSGAAFTGFVEFVWS
jgi:hypothetical protein